MDVWPWFVAGISLPIGAAVGDAACAWLARSRQIGSAVSPFSMTFIGLAGAATWAAFFLLIALSSSIRIAMSGNPAVLAIGAVIAGAAGGAFVFSLLSGHATHRGTAS